MFFYYSIIEKPLIYIDPRKAYKLDQEITKRKKVKDRNLALQKPTILIDSQKACNLDRHLALQKLYYQPEGLYQNVKRLWDACKKADYNFLFNDIKKWLDGQAMYQIFRPPPKNIPYASYSKITKPNSVHQCDLIEILYNEDVDTEFLLPTGERYRECERFARRIVDNMNDTTTQLIGMSPNEATKLEWVYSKPSIKYNRPIGVDEPRLSKGTTIRFLLAPGEWENDLFEQHRITDPIWSPSLHKIRRIVVGKNPPMPVLYYLDESGPRRPFVREQLMYIKEEPMLPPRYNRISRTEICKMDASQKDAKLNLATIRNKIE
ncbi:13840_t:CDS:2, partial [Gigaspora rosea]